MNTATTEELQRKIDSYYWYHSFDFGNGLVAKGVKSVDYLKAEMHEVFNGLDLKDKTVLDIGAWHGSFSFAAKNRGAKRVLAVDSFAWDVCKGRETLDLASSLLNQQIDSQYAEVADISKDFGQFDVVLFLDVFYHLLDPQSCLLRLSECATDLLVVRTAQDWSFVSDALMLYYSGDRFVAGDPTNRWVPNPRLMYELLRDAGFERIYYQDHKVSGRLRGTYHAFRTDDGFRRLVREQPQQWMDLNDPTVWQTTLKGRSISEVERLNEQIEALGFEVEDLRRQLGSRTGLAKMWASLAWRKLWRGK